ncbi:hypothetical protein [Thermovibrio sp.]
MKVVQKFTDSRYEVLVVKWEGEKFLYLKDKELKSETLALFEGEIPLKELLEKHESETDFCLPCHLLLHFEKKVMAAEGAVAELGITFERLKEFKKKLKEVLNEGS